MAPSLRRRLVCFYCGSRSAQTRKPNLGSWQCEKCDAANHLDENGEITDPPASGNYSNARYAQSIQRSTSPVIDKPDESLFCQTCLKNQHVFAETLAAYFPSQDAPNYAEFEKAYPAYRKDLEERYPQVCEECAPRVQERIRATGYAAKTDHLRRMMERTRGNGVPREEHSWKSVLAFVGGTAWLMSLVGQVAWDGLVLSMSGKEHGGLLDESISLSGCIQQAMRGSDLAPGCTELVTPMARLALLLGLLGCWWNPKLQEMSRRRGGRMTGVSEYYKQQALLLLVRFLAYFYLDRTPSSDNNLQKTLGVHVFLLFFCALLTTMSFRTIGIDYTPRVVFQDNPEPLMSRQSQPGKTTTRSTRPNSIPQQLHPYTTSSISGARPFSISDLAPASKQQYPASYPASYQPPTPPPDDDDDDEAMDWTPSQQPTLRPATLYRPLAPASQQPQQNPFRGHLPADVVSQEQRLRNPPNRPTFRKASEISKQNFFRTPKRNVRDFENGSDVGTEYEPSIADNLSPVAPRFADPKLHLQSGQTPVTGLERLLASAFSLSDEPPEIRAAQQEQTQARDEGQSFTNGRHAFWHRLPVLILLMPSYLLWTSALKPWLTAYEVQFRLATLFLAALASIRSLFLAVRKDMAAWSGSDLIIFTAEFAAAMALILAVGHFWNANQGTLETASSTLLAILAVQELWLLSQDIRTTWRYTKTSSSQIPAPDPALSAAPPDTRQQRSARSYADLAPRQIASAVVKAGADQASSTRSRNNLVNGAIPDSGFGGLSLGKTQRASELVGMDSLSLGQPRRYNRNGMW